MLKYFKIFKILSDLQLLRFLWVVNKLIRKNYKKPKNYEPKFLSEYDQIAVKDVKTYQDLNQEKHLMPLEINYKYKIVDFYAEKESKLPTTASETHKRGKLGKRRMVKTSQGKRIKPLRKSSSMGETSNFQNFENIRSPTAGNLVISIPSKRQDKEKSQFPEDFWIENTLVRLYI